MVGNIETIINGVKDKINNEKEALKPIWEGLTADAFFNSLSKNDEIFNKISEQLSSLSNALSEIDKLEGLVSERKTLKSKLSMATTDEEKESYKSQIDAKNSEISTKEQTILKYLNEVSLYSTTLDIAGLRELAVNMGLISPGDELSAETLASLQKYNENHINTTDGNNSEYLIGHLENFASYYMKHIGFYNTTDYKNNTEFIITKLRKDCTGFAVAYMSEVCGVALPETRSFEMVNPNGNFAKAATANGWKVYTTDEITELLPGDVLVSNENTISYSRGGHAEIYVDESHTFGWGSAQTKYPLDNKVIKQNKQGHIVYSDWYGTRSQRDYVTVYRYEG